MRADRQTETNKQTPMKQVCRSSLLSDQNVRWPRACVHCSQTAVYNVNTGHICMHTVPSSLR